MGNVPNVELFDKVERAIVAALVTELHVAGFVLVQLYDGFKYRPVPHNRSNYALVEHALRVVFSPTLNTYHPTLHFAPKDKIISWGARGVMLVLGNGVDIISDWHHDGIFSQTVKRVCDAVDQDRWHVALVVPPRGSSRRKK